MSPDGLGNDKVPHSGQNMSTHRHDTFNHGGRALRTVLFFELNKLLTVIGVITFNSKQEVGGPCGYGIHGNPQP